ncbi:MAG: phosphoribosylformylglycinamidine cyclo-ligase [Clostridiales bacterium]|nr:phosphoribosylformylglycinamidine cyclo-ligase [Clostridiales bacterium]
MTYSRNDAYAEAGVDLAAGYEGVERIKKHVESTLIPGVMGSVGGFGGMFIPDLNDMDEPVLVSGTDGVGTKLKIAFLMDKHDTIGIDCVAMCANDIVCSGAKPLFFLDYLALGKNSPELVESIVSGVADGCRSSGCALIGGETAEMPGFYKPGEYDIAGFCVGIVDKKNIIDGSSVKPGDAIIGLASSGVHSNGFSLIRRIFDIGDKGSKALSVRYDELSCTLGEELLKPTRIYVSAVMNLSSSVRIKAISHITGGGFYENIPRMLPDGIRARIDIHSFPSLPIFEILKKKGNLSSHDMFNTFNMGLGLVMVVDSSDVGAAMCRLTNLGEHPYLIGTCIEGESGVDL